MCSTDPPSASTYQVGDDGKVTVDVPANVTSETIITISDDKIPPNTADVDVVSSTEP